MPIEFSTSTCTVGELFSDGKIYCMPEFQRSFSWTEDRAFQLFDDLDTACNDATGRHGIEYFLGAIIVVKRNGSEPYLVVDGQQRLVTLSTILAVIRDHLPQGPFRAGLQNHIEQPANPARRHSRAARVQLKLNDRDAFQNIVVNDASTCSATNGVETKAISRVLDIVRRLHSDFPDVRRQSVEKLATFILNRCSVVLITTQSIVDAYKLFRSVNNPGEPLSDLAFARAQLTGEIVNDSQLCGKVSQAWDELEDRLGEEELRSYVRTVAQTVVPNIVQEDLYSLVREISKSSLRLNDFNSRLRSFVLNYDKLDDANINFGNRTALTNRHIKCLLNYELQEWRAAALLWLMQGKTNEESYEFFRALDGLCLGLSILRDKRSRYVATRMADVINAIGEGKVLDRAVSPLFLSFDERRKVEERLSQPIHSGSFLRLLLLRLNAAATPLEFGITFPRPVQIEHILPQNPNANSDWLAVFPDEQERHRLTYVLGNLTLLTGRKNREISNSPFSVKKDRIFALQENNGIPLNSHIATHQIWNAEAILRRQDALIRHAVDVMRF